MTDVQLLDRAANEGDPEALLRLLREEDMRGIPPTARLCAMFGLEDPAAYITQWGKGRTVQLQVTALATLLMKPHRRLAIVAHNNPQTREICRRVAAWYLLVMGRALPPKQLEPVSMAHWEKWRVGRRDHLVLWDHHAMWAS